MPIAIQPAPVASASVTVKWNTQSPDGAVVIQHGTLTALNGRIATVRLRDGTLRSFTASQEDVAILRSLIGQRIAFRVR